MRAGFGFQVKFMVIYYKYQQQSKKRIESSPQEEPGHQDELHCVHHRDHGDLENGIES